MEVAIPSSHSNRLFPYLSLFDEWSYAITKTSVSSLSMDSRRAERAETEALASGTVLAPADIARQLGLHLVFDEGAIMALATQADVLSLRTIF
jgi:hypothetical protein